MNQQTQQLYKIIEENKLSLKDGLYKQLMDQFKVIHETPTPKYYKLTYVEPCLGSSSTTMTYYLDKDRNFISTYEDHVENFGINTVIKTSIHDLNHSSLKGRSDVNIATTLKSAVSKSIAMTIPHSLLETTAVPHNGTCIDLTDTYMRKDDRFMNKLHILTHLPERENTEDSECDDMKECIDERIIGIFIRTVVVISVELF